MTDSIQSAQDRERLQAALDHEVRGAWSAAIGGARLHLKEGKSGPALAVLDEAVNKCSALESEARERYDLLDPEKMRDEFYSVRIDDGLHTFLVAAPTQLEAVRHVLKYTARPRRLEMTWLLDGNDPDLNERMGKVES